MSGWTKRQIIAEAFTEIGKGDYAFDLQPEEYQTALRRLDAMMAQWSATLGLRIGYAGGDGLGDLTIDTNVPDWAFEALYLNLAIRLAPSFGKTPSPQTTIGAKHAYDAIAKRTVVPRKREIRGYAGAGRGPWVTRIPNEPTLLETGADGVLDIEV